MRSDLNLIYYFRFIKSNLQFQSNGQRSEEEVFEKMSFVKSEVTQKINLPTHSANNRACKYYISRLGVGGGSEGNAYFAYVKDQNSYSPENGF